MHLETERLLITDLRPDMAQAICENSQDEDTRRFVPDEVFETAEEAAEVINFLISQYGTEDGPLLHPVLKKSGENIGYVQLCPIAEGWEIGYHVAKQYTGNGYATEAVAAFLPVMAKKKGISSVYGICLKENIASEKVMKKCGFRNVFTSVGLYQGEDRMIVKNIWEASDER